MYIYIIKWKTMEFKPMTQIMKNKVEEWRRRKQSQNENELKNRKKQLKNYLNLIVGDEQSETPNKANQNP